MPYNIYKFKIRSWFRDLLSDQERDGTKRKCFPENEKKWS